MPDPRPDFDLDDRPDEQRPPSIPVVDPPPARRPHVEKPAEKQRIHPDGDGRPSKNDKSADEDDGQSDDDESDDNAKKDHEKPRPKKDKGDHAKDKNGKKDGDNKDDKTPSKPLYKRPIFYIALIVLILGAIVGLLYWLHARDYQTTDDAFIEGHAIQISPQVSAKVIKVYIDDNTRVRAGDPLVELDPTDYEVALNQAKGDESASAGKLAQMKAQVASTEASRDEAKANVDAANISYYNADKDLKRYEALDDRARSKQQYDNVVTAAKNAEAQVAQAKAHQASAESQIAVAIANVAAAEGEYETAIAKRKGAEVNLGYCHITAPGTLGGFAHVTTKNVEEGMYAAAGTPLFALVEEHVWVVANYKETQLTDMRLNQPVTLEIDAYPDQQFNGHVDSIQAGSGSRFSVLPAENATGNYVKVVQRVPVKIVFEENQTKDPNRVLVPGMSVTPYVKIR